MTDSNPKAAGRKRGPGRPSSKPKAFVPPKPYAKFPLTPHSSGKWQKKIRGHLFYFGRWGKRVDGKMQRLEGDGWEEALKLYEAQAADLHAGRIPDNDEPKPDQLLLVDLCDEFLEAKMKRRNAGKIGTGMLHEYKRTTDLLIGHWGPKKPVAKLKGRDFSSLMEVLEERFGPVRQCNEITRIKTLFKWAAEMDKIEKLPSYGADFVKPTKAELRKHKNQNGERAWPVEHLRTAISKATVPTKAWLLLGANCGFYARDCADLPLDAVDLDGGWLDWPRGKTGILRRCKLWPETVAALRDWLAVRPDPKEEAAGLVFVTDRGKAYRSDTIGRLASAFVKECGLPGKLQFSWLRHTFRTEADATLDQVAIRLVMGHADDGIDEHYRERIGNDRLERVAEHVRTWLFPAEDAAEKDGAE